MLENISYCLLVMDSTLGDSATAALLNPTLASRAGCQEFVENKIWKSVKLSINRATFLQDWNKFHYFVKQRNIAESEAISQLPFILHHDLLGVFLPLLTTQPDLVDTLEKAKTVLMGIAGCQNFSFDSFSSRVLCIGEETVFNFMWDLQNMAKALDLPEGIVKSQFLNGLPKHVSAELRRDDVKKFTCVELAHFHKLRLLV